MYFIHFINSIICYFISPDISVILPLMMSFEEELVLSRKIAQTDLNVHIQPEAKLTLVFWVLFGIFVFVFFYNNQKF